eukprot:2105293-Prymnesium_polylepis.2
MRRKAACARCGRCGLRVGNNNNARRGFAAQFVWCFRFAPLVRLTVTGRASPRNHELRYVTVSCAAVSKFSGVSRVA